MKKKALVVGINEYEYDNYEKLKCCVDDAKEIKKLLEKNEDGKKNFDVKLLIDNEATRANVFGELEKLFNDENIDVALLYFSGHGHNQNGNGGIVTFGNQANRNYIGMLDILSLINNSKVKNKLVILDCCYSGRLGNDIAFGDNSILPEGTIIMTASDKNEPSYEVNGHGIFTNLLVEALNGGASDIMGRVTPGGIYAYIDEALSCWEQRPLFKTNVSRFIVLRENKEKISFEDIKQITNLFQEKKFEFQLDPSFEPTNTKRSRYFNLKPYASEENIAKFNILQKYNHQGLVEPIGEKHMYYAAMEFKKCKLTALGQHYWNLVKNNRI